MTVNFTFLILAYLLTYGVAWIMGYSTGRALKKHDEDNPTI